MCACEKNRCNVCFSGNCFSREKTVMSSAHAVVFNIYMCARRIARTNRVVDFDFAFFSVELTILTKKKNRRADSRKFEKRIFLNVTQCVCQIESRAKNLSAICRIKIIVDKTLCCISLTRRWLPSFAKASQK